MIVDHITHQEAYREMGSDFAEAMAWLESLDESVHAGAILLGDRRLSARVIETMTSPAEEKLYEAHRRHIDIHYVLSGTEDIEYEQIQKLKVAVPYNENEDVCMLEGEGRPSSIRLHAGDVCILYPQDAHKPCCCAGKPSPVKKVVIKIRANPDEKAAE